ncbi:hypothetical protein AB3S75_035637 [Citrus x aurantiifolia]
MECGMFVKALIFLLLCALSSVSGKVLPEKTILLEFKNSVSDPSGILSSWQTNTSSHCSWFGVSCDSESRVIALNITGGDVSEGNSKPFFSCLMTAQFPFYGFGMRRRTCLHGRGKLVGKLSPLVGGLSELRVLSLPFNGFSGEFPPEIWGLEKLEVLDVEGNFLSGRLPNEFVGLRNLRVLNLAFNRIDGDIPFSLRNFESLEVLNLAGNQVKGVIPGFLGSFLKLRVLFLSYNELNGSIPTELGKYCRYLEHLDLSGNSLVGRIPSSLGKCQQLRTLLLFSNMLNDVIPRELGWLRKLEVLDVSRNRLNGLIPTELGNCVELSVLVLSNLFDPLLSGRNIRGELSVGQSNASNGEKNSFIGSIPMEITTLSKLRIIWAPRLNLEGKLPSSWGACESLEMLNLAQNVLRGDLIGVFDRCKKLHFIDLSSNEISGELDVKLQVPCMALFDVSGNHMSGSIPRFDYNVCHQMPLQSSDLLQAYDPSFTYMQYFMSKARLGTPLLVSAARFMVIHNFSGNNFTGPICWLPVAPERLRRRTDYAFLAGANKLTGSFPESLFRTCNEFHGMVANLSNNNIIGHIPLDIGVMCKSLRVLDASHNQISGIVPQSLENLTSLVFLDLSGNKLQGEIPSSLHRLKYLRHLSLADNNLTGGIPSSIGGLRSLEVLELSSNSLSGDFNTSNCIGSGGFGTTYKAEISPGILVAVKKLAVGRFQHGVQQFHAEIKTLGNVRHPNLVTLIGYRASGNEMFLIYNYLPGGNLENFIKARTSRAVDWMILHKIALDVASALAYLHDQCAPRVLHRDVKPSNILLDDDFNAYLSDFGLSRLLGTSETHATTGVAGTFGYVAPEYALTCRVSDKADVYSYGVVLLELISDKKALDPSFSSHGDGFNIISWASMLLRQGQVKDVFNAELWASGPHDDLEDMLHLALRCTVETLSTRPTMKQVVQCLKQIQHSPN